MLITCSNCQSKIRVPDSAAGKKGKCPKCGAVIAIPLEESPAEEAAAEPAAEEPAGGSPFDFDEPAAPRKGKSARTTGEETEEEAEAGGEGEAKQESPALSIVALVLGILSLVCGCGTGVAWYCAPLPILCAIGALVCGLLGMKRGGRVMGIIGASLGGVSILLTIIMIVLNIVLFAGVVGLGAMKGLK
jgi:predicted Zn finger-like uncharacterized protein